MISVRKCCSLLSNVNRVMFTYVATSSKQSNYLCWWKYLRIIPMCTHISYLRHKYANTSHANLLLSFHSVVI